MAEILFFVAVTYCVRGTRDLHLHHYTISMTLVVFLGIQRPIFSFLCGLNNGVMVEGGARWGYDPIWIKRPPPCEVEDDKSDDDDDEK